MVYDFLVIGATGMQGRIASRDLLQSGYSVLLAGRDKPRIEHILKKYPNRTGFAHVELRDKENIIQVIKKSGTDVVINCAEGDYNIDVLKECIKQGVNYLDLGSDDWMTEIQFALHNSLKNKNLLSLTGCGSIPGIVNVMAKFAADKFDKIERIDCGFDWDSNMKTFVVPYSIDTIVDEFVKKSNVIRDGKVKYIDPLTCEIDHKLIGIPASRARSIMHQEVYTFYRAFKNKGIKTITSYGGFPDHSFNAIMELISLGLCSHDPVMVEGVKHLKINFITESFKHIGMPKGYTEKEDLWIILQGKKDGEKKRTEMVCTAGTLKGWEDATCNIDTGMPISIMAQMVKKGLIKEKGSYSPENIVPHQHFFKELAKRDMHVYENKRRIN